MHIFKRKFYLMKLGWRQFFRFNVLPHNLSYSVAWVKDTGCFLALLTQARKTPNGRFFW